MAKRPTNLTLAAGCLAGAISIVACSSSPQNSGTQNSSPQNSSTETMTPQQYPATRTVEVVDDYHGTKVADPYRWLEDLDQPEVQAWIAAQNVVSDAYLAAVPAREQIRARLTELWNFARKSPPTRAGQRFLWRLNDGLQNQAVLYVGDAADGPGRVLLDPNKLSADGTVALGGAIPSDDGRYLAYGISKSGSDWTEWHVLEIATGRQLDDHLQWTKFTSAAWTHDAAGFFYQRYPAPKEGETYEARNLAPELCYHKLGTPQSTDQVIYARPDQPTWGFAPTVTEDGRYLVISIWTGTDSRNRVAYLDLQDQAAGVRPLLMDFDASYAFVGSVGTRLYFQTNQEAPRGRVISFELAQPERANWTEVVAQQKDTLEGMSAVGGRLVLTYLRDAAHAVAIHDLAGKRERELTLPGPCSVDGLSGKLSDPDVHFLVTSFLLPGSIYRYEFASGALTEQWRPTLAFDPTKFVAKQVFLQSGDGTRVPMFLVHRQGLALDGKNPTYLYGYGGFNVSLTPSFSTAIIAWLERGGILAQPTLRGGGEYGEDWHQAGMRERKQKVFDDFAAAAQYLIRNGYTNPSKLAAGGGSNGGLLVGAAITQHPELFAAAIPQVGVLDMLRYHRFTIGWAWEPEYGSADDAAMFAVLHKYSPLHNLKAGAKYPATMVVTGDHDDRVMPAHSYKFAAALQAAQGGTAPILLRVDVKTGHGAGKPTDKQIASVADMWAFLTRALDLE